MHGIRAKFTITRRVTRALAFAASLASAGCAGSPAWVDPRWRAPALSETSGSDLDSRVLLVGDAGMPRLDGPEPVLAALAREAGTFPDRTCVVFLGDNVYPHGLPAEPARDRRVAEARLAASIDAVAASGARVVFVSGNHDYALDGWPGWEREGRWIDSRGFANVQARPLHGCAGPDVLDVGQLSRLVFLDTQSWLEDGARAPASACPLQSDAQITAALDSVLAASSSRRVIVAAHHPLASHGHHGGHFTWRDHLFPLTAAASWAWVPLPGVGSLYPVARWLGITNQDLSSSRYGVLRRSLQQAFNAHPPLVYAAGHEHGLQVLEGPRLPWLVVSGAGTVERPDAVGRGDDTRFACACAGFMRLDVLRDGRVRLDVLQVDGAGRVSQPLGRWLTTP